MLLLENVLNNFAFRSPIVVWNNSYDIHVAYF